MTYNEILDFVRAIAPLGSGAFVLAIVMLLRKRPEPGSPLGLLLEDIEFRLARRRARKAVHGKLERVAYDLATKEIAGTRKIRDQSPEIVPIRQKRKLPSRRARDPAEDHPA